MKRLSFTHALSVWALTIAVILLSACTVTVLTPTPTTPQIQAAQGNQSLILVADFEDRSGGKHPGLNPAEYIADALKTQVKSDGLEKSIGIQRLRQVLDDASALEQGKTYSATLIVWGWYDALNTQSYIQPIKLPKEQGTSFKGVRVSLADTSKIETAVVTEQPDKVKFQMFLTLGADRSASGDYDQAIQYLTSAIAAGSDVSDKQWAYFQRGEAYSGKGDQQRANTDYDEAIKLDPDNSLYYAKRAEAQISTRNYDQGIADLNQAIKLRPDYAVYYVYRAMMYLTRSIDHDSPRADYDLAIADSSYAIKLKPDNAYLFCVRGFVYKSGDVLFERKGNREQAIADFKQCLALAKDSSTRTWAIDELQSLGVQP